MKVELAPYDPMWPEWYEAERAAIAAALGPVAVRIQHVGSTSVPGLRAKPLIDICLEVPDSADEGRYVPALEVAGYEFRIREPEWFEHRLLRREPRRVNVHVFSAGCPEVAQMVGFRDWLRAHPDDRDRYERAKLELAELDWPTVQDYADAKTEVVSAIKRTAGLID